MKKPFIIGIAGCTQSGKSTFTKELEKALSDITLKTYHIDNYHKPKDEQPIIKAPFTNKTYTDFNSLVSFDTPQLFADLQKEVSLSKVDLIIVEGTLILYDENILNMLDLKLFVETRADERAVRYIDSYSQHHGHDFIKNSYLDLVRYRMDEYIEPTKWRADMILNGSAMSKQAINIIKTYLISQV